MTDYAVKACTTLMYDAIPQAVDRHPAATPIAIARGLVDRMTSDETRVILEQFVAQRVRTAQQVRTTTAAAHLCSRVTRN